MKLLSIISLAALAVACGGRPPPILTPELGDRVRVTAPLIGVNNRAGTLRRLDADSLVMRPEQGEPSRLAITLAYVTRFEVHRGEKSQTGKGAGIGFAFGAVGGIIFGVAASESFKGQDTGICDDGCIPPMGL